MRINFSTNAALNNNTIFSKKNSPSFNGLAIEKSTDYKTSGDYGGGQGSYDIFVKTIEYRPYKDENSSEIIQNMKALSIAESYVNPKEYGGSEIITEKNVMLGNTLDCTKEAAAIIIENLK